MLVNTALAFAAVGLSVVELIHGIVGIIMCLKSNEPMLHSHCCAS